MQLLYNKKTSLDDMAEYLQIGKEIISMEKDLKRWKGKYGKKIVNKYG